MQARALLLPLILFAVPFAAAAYGSEGQVEAAAPVAIDGRVETWLPDGTASFVGSGATQPLGFRMSASEATVIVRTFEQGCDGVTLPTGPSTCAPGAYRVTDQTYLVDDLTLTAVRATSAYKIVATTDRSHADTRTFGDDGRIIVTTASGTLLDTNKEGQHLSPLDGNWASDSETNVVEPVYGAEAYSAKLVASAPAVLTATGGFEAFFQGTIVEFRGTGDKGEISQTVDTKIASSEGASFKVIMVEVVDGELQGSSAAAFTGYAPADQRPVSDVHARAEFSDATGTVDYADQSDRTLDKEDITLNGPLSLTLTKVSTGNAPRMSYAIVDGLQLAALEDAPEDEPIPPAALAAAGAAGAGGAGLLIALAYFWPRLKYAWALAFLPMYTRIERDAVLEHEKRDELYELIRAAPGIHAHEIGEKAHIGWGTTVYHLKLLENHGLIVSKKSGRYKRFFVNTGEYTKKKDIYGALRNETAKSVAQFIVDHPGTTQKDMCAALGIQPSLASWHVEKLEGVELVKRVKDGRMVRYFAGPAWAELNVRVNPLTGGGDAPAET